MLSAPSSQAPPRRCRVPVGQEAPWLLGMVTASVGRQGNCFRKRQAEGTRTEGDQARRQAGCQPSAALVTGPNAWLGGTAQLEEAAAPGTGARAPEAASCTPHMAVSASQPEPPVLWSSLARIHPAAPASGQARLQEERSPELEGQGEQKHPRGHRACSLLAQAWAAQPSALGTVTRTIVGLRPLPCPSCAALQDHASQQMVQWG